MSDFEVCPVGTQARLAAIELVLDRAEQCAETEAKRADKAEAELRRLAGVEAERDSMREILDHIPQVEAELGETSDRLHAIEAERDALQADYGKACKLVSDMHAAATGRPGEGPRLGVIEDVAAVRAECDALRAALKLIAATDPVDAALDPERAARIANAALAKVGGGNG